MGGSESIEEMISEIEEKKLFAGSGSVRIVKDCELGLANEFLRPRSQFFTNGAILNGQITYISQTTDRCCQTALIPRVLRATLPYHFVRGGARSEKWTPRYFVQR